MSVEPARAGDLEAIRALLAASKLPTQDLAPALLGDFVVMRDGAGLAGVAGLEVRGDAGLIRSVAVASALRGRGLGATLVDAVEAHARKRGVRTLWLLTTTAADFFARRGYARAERGTAPASIQATSEFTLLCPSTAVCLVRKL